MAEAAWDGGAYTPDVAFRKLFAPGRVIGPAEQTEAAVLLSLIVACEPEPLRKALDDFNSAHKDIGLEKTLAALAKSAKSAETGAPVLPDMAVTRSRYDDRISMDILWEIVSLHGNGCVPMADFKGVDTKAALPSIDHRKVKFADTPQANAAWAVLNNGAGAHETVVFAPERVDKENYATNLHGW